MYLPQDRARARVPAASFKNDFKRTQFDHGRPIIARRPVRGCAFASVSRATIAINYLQLLPHAMRDKLYPSGRRLQTRLIGLETRDTFSTLIKRRLSADIELSEITPLRIIINRSSPHER